MTQQPTTPVGQDAGPPDGGDCPDSPADLASSSGSRQIVSAVNSSINSRSANVHPQTEIEQTRSDLSRNVNALGEAVSPGNVARRQVGKVGSAASDLKDRVMGTADDAGSAVSGSVSGAAGSISDAASGLK